MSKDTFDSIIEYAKRSGASAGEIEQLEKEAAMMRKKPDYQPGPYFNEENDFNELEKKWSAVENPQVRQKLMNDLKNLKEISSGKVGLTEEQRQGSKKFKEWRDPSLTIQQQFANEKAKAEKKAKIMQFIIAAIMLVIFSIYAYLKFT